MMLQKDKRQRWKGFLSCIFGFCALLGCSKATAPAPMVIISVTKVATNSAGEVFVQLSLNNNASSAVLVNVRSAIYYKDGAWITNFNIRPRFVGLGSSSSDASGVTVAAGRGITTALSPMSMQYPFQLQFVCFPTRSGVAGMVDDATDKARELRNGSGHESYLGENFFLLSRVIDPMTEPGGAVLEIRPFRLETNQSPEADDSNR